MSYARGAVWLQAVALVAAIFGAPAYAQDPAPPYWSVELGRYDTREAALKDLKNVTLPQARAEQRPHGWYLRAGAFSDKARADSALKAAGRKGRVLHIEHAVPWVTAGAAPAAVAAVAAPPPPKPIAARPAQAAPAPAEPAPKPIARAKPAAAAAPAAAARDPDSDLTGLDLEELLSVQVTGVTGRGLSYLQTPAAVFVLTGEDLRRAGVRSIAQALRMVPGLQVYRSSAQDYTITSRGFGGDKLQVLVDGRSVYSPLTSTVFWDVLDTYLADVDRIEVIRGPGATLWGANAVNGVINIVTHSAADTQGTHVYAGAGNEERDFGGFRTGGRIGEGSARVYVKGAERDSTKVASGADRADGISKVQAGARYDGPIGAGQLTLSGNAYKARIYSAAFPSGATTDTDASGRDLELRWSHPWVDGGETVTNLYYDGYDRFAPTIYSESRDTYDARIQHNFAARGAHRLTAGIGSRASHDETGGPPLLIVFQPPSRTNYTYDAFVQDEIALAEQWSLVLGSKFEKATFTHFEYEPSARLAWNVSPEATAWLSVSRATRAPNRLDHDIGILCTGAGTPVPDCSSNGQVLSIGSPIDSERLIAYETGLRMQLTPAVVADLSLFANNYTDLRTTEAGLKFDNKADAHAYGGELNASWRAADWASLSAWYSYITIDARTDQGSTDTTTVATLERGTPHDTAGLRVGLQPWSQVSVDSFLRYVDNVPSQKVPAYTELNLRLGWQATPAVELSLVGENLLDSKHPETGTPPATRAEIERSVFASLSWRLW